ncbi:hypothetical protein RCL1_002846 [Eukaryota sp. TZLM3-RCL]
MTRIPLSLLVNSDPIKREDDAATPFMSYTHVPLKTHSLFKPSEAESSLPSFGSVQGFVQHVQRHSPSFLEQPSFYQSQYSTPHPSYQVPRHPDPSPYSHYPLPQTQHSSPYGDVSAFGYSPAPGDYNPYGIQSPLQGNHSYDASAKKRSTKFAPEQTILLRAAFESNPRPSASEVIQLANQVGLSSRQVKIWFQNARSRSKSKPGEDPQ